MDRYIFPAIFDICVEGGYCVTFPDLSGIVTEGDTLEEAYSMARDALELCLYGMEQDNDPIPQPNLPSAIPIPPGGFVSLIEAWMPPVREEMLSRSVKKTLTIPKWLNDVAEQKNVNYSQLLQASLKEFLGVNEPSYLKK